MKRTSIGARAAAAVVLMFGVGSIGYVEAEVPSMSPGHYPLDHSGGVAVSSANLDEYLARLQELATARQFLMTFGDLSFSVGSTRIGDREKGELVRMADFLRAHPSTVAQIIGHADDRSDATANARLAGERAAAVRSYLIVQGIDESRLTAVNAGEERPLPLRNNSTPGVDGNRRVQILVQKPELGQ